MPQLRAIGRFARVPMKKQAIIDVIAVELMSCRLKSSLQARYSSLNGPFKVDASQDPPESAKMRGFTARIYAIVRNVAVAPRNSVVKLLPRSL